MKDYIYQAYIKPLSLPHFGWFCQANILGIFGCTLIGLSYLIDLSGLSQGTATAFFLCEAIMIGMIIMPLGFYLYQKLSYQTWSRMLLIMTIIPVFGLMIGLENYFIRAILYSFSTTAFWLLFHIFMTKRASLNNKGNEVSVALNGIAIGGLLGTIAATACAVYTIPLFHSSLIGSILCFISIVQMLKAVSCLNLSKESACISINKHQIDTIKNVISSKPKRAFNTVLSGILEIPYCTLWPIWLLKNGYEVAITGIILAITILLKCVISGYAGRLTNHNNGADLRLSGFVFIIGIVPWFYDVSMITIIITMLAWAFGNHFRQVGLSAQWYDNQSLSCLSAQEILLGIGRVIGIILAIPLLFKLSPLYIAFTFFAVCLFFIANISTKRVIEVQLEPLE
jgi:hypothetical protein